MPTLCRFLVDRLKGLTKHVFGVPGDYVLDLYDQLSGHFDMVGTTDEQCAGFAADAYARVNSFGVVCATYCVGGFKLLNPIAGAYAEKSPVLFISGAPGVDERDSTVLLHHVAGAYECQHNVFKNVSCATAVIDDPSWACHEIDRVLQAILHYKQPGYIEIPRDMVNKNVSYDLFSQTHAAMPEDQENLAEALEKSLAWIQASDRPVILAGVELARFGLGEDLIQFARRNNIPIATSLLGKSVVNEHDPLSLGVYCGKMSNPSVQHAVENSDCVIMLGVLQTDMNFGFQPFQCNRTNVIMANTDRLRIRRSTYENVSFRQFTEKLLSSKLDKKKSFVANVKQKPTCFCPKTDTKITSARMFEALTTFVEPHHAIVADVGDSLFGAADIPIHKSHQFLAAAFYTSMGFAVPAALGMHLALPEVRPIVIVGDGAFQMTGMEVSTIVRSHLNAIVLVLNNSGYSTERFLRDGKYNDIQPWQYHKLPELIGGGRGYYVETEEQLDLALRTAINDESTAAIINIIVDKKDATPALRRMMDNLSKKI